MQVKVDICQSKGKKGKPIFAPRARRQRGDPGPWSNMSNGTYANGVRFQSPGYAAPPRTLGSMDTQRNYPNGVKQPSLPAKHAVPVPARHAYINRQPLALCAMPVPAVTMSALLAKQAVPVPARRK